MTVGILKLDIHLPGNRSLKDKRRIIKSLTTRLRNNFNISISEIDYQDLWQRTLLGVGMIADGNAYIQHNFSNIVNFIKKEKEIYLIATKEEIL